MSRNFKSVFFLFKRDYVIIIFIMCDSCCFSLLRFYQSIQISVKRVISRPFSDLSRLTLGGHRSGSDLHQCLGDVGTDVLDGPWFWVR